MLYISSVEPLSKKSLFMHATGENEDFFHDDVFSFVFRLFIQVLSSQKSTAMLKNVLAFLESSFWPLKPTVKAVKMFSK